MKQSVKLFTLMFTLLTFLTGGSVLAAPPASGITLRSPMGETEILSWQFGAGVGVSSVIGGGDDREVSRPSISEISLTKYTDDMSPLLLKALARGEVFGRMGIVHDILTIELHDVIITGYSVSGADSRNPLSESVSLNFTRITYRTGTVEYCYDIELNKDC